MAYRHQSSMKVARTDTGETVDIEYVEFGDKGRADVWSGLDGHPDGWNLEFQVHGDGDEQAAGNALNEMRNRGWL